MPCDLCYEAAQGGGPNDGLVTVTNSLFGNPSVACAELEYPELVVRAPPATVEDVRRRSGRPHCRRGTPLWFRPSDTYDQLAFFAGLTQFSNNAYTTQMSLAKAGRGGAHAGVATDAGIGGYGGAIVTESVPGKIVSVPRQIVRDSPL